MRAPLSRPARDQIRGRVAEGRATALDAIERFKQMLAQHQEESQIFGNFPSLFMGLVAADGAWEHYGGHLRFVDGAGNIVADHLDPTRYQEFIGEAVESWSYLKSPYYRPIGYPDGIYRVGPLARLWARICAQAAASSSGRLSAARVGSAAISRSSVA